jgi:hypothetical protein
MIDFTEAPLKSVHDGPKVLVENIQITALKATALPTELKEISAISTSRGGI